MFRRVLNKIDSYFGKSISIMVVLCLLFMVALSFLQVLLRNFAHTGIGWAEIVLRHAVIAVGMFGAVLAARQGRQIGIDVISRIAGPALKKGLAWLVGVFTIIVCIALVKASYIFVLAEYEYGTTLIEGLPAWPFQVIIPLGFALIAFQVMMNLLLGRYGDSTLPVEKNEEVKDSGSNIAVEEDVEENK